MIAVPTPQPPARHCGDRHVCGCHRDVPAPLCLDCAQPRPQTGCSLRDHPKSHASLAFRPNDRGLSLGHCAALSAAGPRQIVWSGVPLSSSSDRWMQPGSNRSPPQIPWPMGRRNRIGRSPAYRDGGESVGPGQDRSGIHCLCQGEPGPRSTWRRPATGNTPHMAGELFKMITGVNMVHVRSLTSEPAG